MREEKNYESRRYRSSLSLFLVVFFFSDGTFNDLTIGKCHVQTILFTFSLRTRSPSVCVERPGRRETRVASVRKTTKEEEGGEGEKKRKEKRREEKERSA